MSLSIVYIPATMARSIDIEAFAKINIGLSIGSRMPDGYHPISSVFHSIFWGDGLRITERQGRGVKVRGDFDCPPEATTIHRAATLFLRQRRVAAGLVIEADKRIPVQAGLGGGSADAAAVLVALDRLFPGRQEPADLAGMALEIGSDVPFFLSGGAAFVGGRGEKVEKIEPRLDLGILIIKPAFGMSTARAYSELDAERVERATDHEASECEPLDPGPLDCMASASCMLKCEPSSWTFRNDFLPLLFKNFREYRALSAGLKEAGAGFVSISGSGSCIFGVFNSYQAALAAQGRLGEAIAGTLGQKTLSGMVLRSIKPLETSLVLQ